jgi:hypothetical protein
MQVEKGEQMASIRSLLGRKKKKTLGFTEKQRTREEINQEYNHHAVMYGHVSRVIAQQQETRAEHMAAMVRLNAEGLKLPPLPAAEAPAEVKQEETAPV